MRHLRCLCAPMHSKTNRNEWNVRNREPAIWITTIRVRYDRLNNWGDPTCYCCVLACGLQCARNAFIAACNEYSVKLYRFYFVLHAVFACKAHLTEMVACTR